MRVGPDTSADDLTAMFDQGMAAFVACPHDSDGWWPAHVHLSGLSILVTCVACARPWPLGDTEFVTSQEARERFGWVATPSGPLPS